jgi:hypothetical protein
MSMIDLSYRIENLDEVTEKLGSIPGAVPFAVAHAIQDTLKAVRTQAARAARERYNIPYSWVLSSLGTPRVAGMYGLMQSTGQKAKLSMFPHSVTSGPHGGGEDISELKSHAMHLRHVFHQGVLTRGSAGAPRYPLRAMVGLAAPQMIHQQGQVWPNIERFERQKLQERLQHYVDQILSGGISV